MVRQDTGEVVLSKAVRDVQTNLGRFQVLDFSEVHAPGLYVLRAGNDETPPFAVGDDVWRQAMDKTHVTLQLTEGGG